MPQKRIWASPCISFVASICRSIQTDSKQSLLCDEGNDSADISKVLVYAMAACRIIETSSLVYLWVFYIGIIALITTRGVLISSTHSKIHTELRTTH